MTQLQPPAHVVRVFRTVSASVTVAFPHGPFEALLLTCGHLVSLTEPWAEPWSRRRANGKPAQKRRCQRCALAVQAGAP